MDELIEFLEENGVEITDELESEIEGIWNDNLPDTEDLFTQDDVDEIVQKRLARAEKSYETEIEELKEAMEDMVDPEKVEEYENKIEELEGKAKEREKELKAEYELQLAAKDAGVKDPDYFEYLAEKKGIKERLSLDEEGNVFATDEDGNILTEDGEKLGPSALIEEIKEEKPEVFGEKNKGEDIGGGGNPGGSGPQNKNKNTKSLAMELGYKSEKESE